MHRAGGHHPDPLARGDLPVHDADVGDDAAVGVVDRVEDHRASGGVGVADRRGHPVDHRVEHRGDAVTGLGADPQDAVGVAADEVGDLGGVALGVGRREVDLVEHGDDLEVVLHGQVEVGQGLRLDALRGVDQQDRALARGERAADLVGEVDVARGVDEVQDVVAHLAVRAGGAPGQAHVLRLDRDAALALDVHAVEVLGAVGPVPQHAGHLQHAVGQRRLAVVDVGDDAEVADTVRRRERLVGVALRARPSGVARGLLGGLGQRDPHVSHGRAHPPSSHDAAPGPVGGASG